MQDRPPVSSTLSSKLQVRGLRSADQIGVCPRLERSRRFVHRRLSTGSWQLEAQLEAQECEVTLQVGRLFIISLAGIYRCPHYIGMVMRVSICIDDDSG